MLYLLLQITPEIALEILTIDDKQLTGFGIALFVSLSFNFLLWYELRSVHEKFIGHLQKSDETLRNINQSLTFNK